MNIHSRWMYGRIGSRIAQKKLKWLNCVVLTKRPSSRSMGISQPSHSLLKHFSMLFDSLKDEAELLAGELVCLYLVSCFVVQRSRIKVHAEVSSW